MAHASIITDFGEFQKILPAWKKMLSRCPQDNIFISHPYLTIWWQHFGKDHRLFVILIEENGIFIAAAPLCIRELGIFGYKLRLLEIIGTSPVPTRPMGLSDRVGLPVINGRTEALDMIFDVLLENRFQWDIIYLKGVNFTDNFSLAHMNRILSPKGQKITSIIRYCSPYLALQGTFDEYEKGRSKNFRKQLTRHRKKLRGMGTLEIEKGENASSNEIIENAFRLMQQSPMGHMGSALFLNRHLRDFFQDLFSAFIERDWIWIRFLKSGNKRIAHEICFHYSQKLYSYNSAYDMEYRSVSPGTLLTTAIIEEAFTSGVTEYDMLRGDESYKLRWSPTMRKEHEIVIAPPGLQSNLFLYYQTRLKPWVKKHKNLASWYERITLKYRKFLHFYNENPEESS